MKMTFYANNRSLNPGGLRSTVSCPVRNRPGANAGNTKSKKEIALEALISQALRKNEGDQKKRTDILGELDMFRINSEIAHFYGDKHAAKDCERKFIRYLNQIINAKE